MQTQGRRRLPELVLLFLAGPALYAWQASGTGWLFPALWAWGACCLVVLLRSRGFSRRRLGSGGGDRRWVGPVVLRFLVVGSALTLTVALLDADALFALPRQRPGLWAMIMVGYPLASVYPQEVIFRAYFFHRYEGLFGRRALLLASSALVFGWVHVVFHNWISVVLSSAGGFLFASTYERTGSTLAASLEHALYGCLVFTVGLGPYFYSGAG